MARGGTSAPYLYDVALIRTLAVSAIFIVHAFAIFTGGWKIDRPLPDVPLFRIVPALLSSFRMQALVFVAGYVHAFQRIERGRDVSGGAGAFVARKARRLLLPWLVFGALYLVLFGPEEGMGYLRSFAAGPGHLWFLPMLFWCYVVVFAIERAGVRFHWVWVPVYAVVHVSSPLLRDFLGVNWTMRYLVYFLLGYAAYGERARITAVLHSLAFRAGATGAFLAWFALTYGLADAFILPGLPMKVGRGFLFVNQSALSVLGVLALYANVSWWVGRSARARSSPILRNINRYAYGLYVYHQFVMMAVLRWYCLPQRVPLPAVPFVLLASGVVGAGLLTIGTVQTRLGRALLG